MINDARIRVIIGHYGSGKTEFSVNYAMALATQSDKKVAIADLDVVNPYFRSRERHEIMEEAGVKVLSSMMGNNVSFDLPSMDPGILGPLQNHDYNVILDVGGDAAGARVMARYKKYLVDGDYDMFAVVNCSRPETQTVDGIIMHIKSIESTVGVKVTGIINNTHMLRETTIEHVLMGQEIIQKAAAKLGIPIKYTSAITSVIEALPPSIEGELLGINMYMRDVWM
jgi:hypothetical protein